MADESLNTPIAVQAQRIDATLLPPTFSQPYRLYVIQQGADILQAAERANKAASGAYDAQTKNDEQDGRLASAESNIRSLRADVGGIRMDYVSRSAVAQQSLSSPLSVAAAYLVNGVKVVGARQTGWTPGTGTPNLSAFNADQAYSVSATYAQSEIQALASGLIEARQRIKALEDMARNHGLIE